MVFETSQTIAYIAVSLFFTLVVFLITREFWCWYFKINERNKLLERQNALLLKLCKYEKYRMIEDNHIDQEKFNFVKWSIDDDLNVRRKAQSDSSESI